MRARCGRLLTATPFLPLLGMERPADLRQGLLRRTTSPPVGCVIALPPGRPRRGLRASMREGAQRMDWTSRHPQRAVDPKQNLRTYRGSLGSLRAATLSAATEGRRMYGTQARTSRNCHLLSAIVANSCLWFSSVRQSDTKELPSADELFQ